MAGTLRVSPGHSFLFLYKFVSEDFVTYFKSSCDHVNNIHYG